MPFELWLSYAALCLMFGMSPGPAVLLVMSQAMSRGFRAGCGAIGGIQVGNVIYVAVSATGIGAILVASETAFLTIKYAGAAYLIYLGIRTIRSAAAAAEAPTGPVPLWRGSFSQGLVNQLANPKAILFYSALFPQFIDYRSGDILPQLVILAATDIVIEVPVLIIYATIAARGGRWMASGARAIWRERICGAALITVGGALSLVRKTA